MIWVGGGCGLPWFVLTFWGEEEGLRGRPAERGLSAAHFFLPNRGPVGRFISHGPAAFVPRPPDAAHVGAIAYPGRAFDSASPSSRLSCELPLPPTCTGGTARLGTRRPGCFGGTSNRSRSTC